MNEIKNSMRGGHVSVTIDFKAVAIPKPGIGLSEAMDKWLENSADNRILDYGDENEPKLLVASESSRTVLYELIPEMCPPGFTVEQAMAHLKSAGFDVRGQGPQSRAGNPTIVVSEKKVN